MQNVMRFLSFLVSAYILLLFVRIILTWFSWVGNSRFLDILARITDPYLNLFRRLGIFQIGFLDFSPIIAIGVLSLVNSIIGSMALSGAITIGVLLSTVLKAAWAIVSFLIGFLIVVLVLRLITFAARLNLYNPIWGMVDKISKPVLYRISRILFRNRIVKFTTLVIISILILGLIYVALKILVAFVSGILLALPV